LEKIPINFEEGTKLLQRLIQFNTTNPPGNERACIEFIKTLLEEEGFEVNLYGKTPNRPNLITRLKGNPKGEPFLLYGHIDVVTTENQNWQHPPFSGIIKDGYLWGRGALDMKGGVAMMIQSLINLKRANFQPAGDLVLLILSDEEAGGTYGAQYMVENYADLLKGIRFSLGEFGGFPIRIGKNKFYAIQIAEKQICWLKGTIKGRGGHASFPMRNGTMAKLARVLQKFNDNRLPYHLLPVVKQMFLLMAENAEPPFSDWFRDLTNPDKVISTLEHMGIYGRLFEPMMFNNVNVTVVKAGHKTNVIPSEVYLEMDVRILPGQTDKDVIREINDLVGNDLDLEILSYSPNDRLPDMTLFDSFAKVLKDLDEDGVPIPLLLAASTDARHFDKIGIQTYGFIPMNLPENFDMLQYIHAADERIPLSSFRFGLKAIQNFLMQYKG